MARVERLSRVLYAQISDRTAHQHAPRQQANIAILMDRSCNMVVSLRHNAGRGGICATGSGSSR